MNTNLIKISNNTPICFNLHLNNDFIRNNILNLKANKKISQEKKQKNNNI